MLFSSLRAPLAAAVLCAVAAGQAHAQQCRLEVPFALNSAQVPANYAPVLQRIAEVHPQSRIAVQGHTDRLGNAAANRALSERRAQAVAAMLAGNGVSPGNMEVAALGESQPRDAAAGASQANRRVEILIDECRFANLRTGDAPATGPGIAAPAQVGLGVLGAAAVLGAIASGGSSTGATGGT